MKGNLMMRGFLLVGLALVLASCGGLLLQSPPGSVEILVSAISAAAAPTTVDITWTTNVPTTHLVEYGTASGVYTDSTFQSQTAFTSHTVSLSGLTDATMYYYRVRNFHTSLPDTVSAESSFATTASTPPTLAQKQRGVWIIGGLSGSTIGTAVGQVDLYDPVLDTWYASASTLPTPVSFAAASSWGGNIYVIGGFDSTGNVRNIVQIYDVDNGANGTWSSGAAMPPAAGLGRANIHSVVVNDKIYVLGGTTNNAAIAWAGPAATFKSWEYNPTADSWTQKADYVAGVTTYSERFSLPFNDVIYNLGGRSAAATATTAHDGFAVTTNGLTQGTEVVLTSGRTGITGVIYAPAAGPAIIAIAGGFTALTLTSGNFVVQGTTASTSSNLFQYLYYPFTSPAVWTGGGATGFYPQPVGFSSAALYGSKMYVFGGTNSVTTAVASGLNNVYWFDLDTVATGGTWTASASMPTGRYGLAAVIVRQ